MNKFDPQTKLLFHGDRVKQWLETGKTSPILVEIAPTGYCNANCSWCDFKDNHDSDRINTEFLINEIEKLANSGLKAINWTGGGEPTLHPDFEKFIRFADSKNLKQGLFTNSLKEIPCQDVFQWIRVSLTDRGYEGIEKPTVPFGINLNHTDHTEEHLRHLCKTAKDFGASYFQVRPALIGSYDAQPKLECPLYLKEYETDDFKVYTTDYKYEECNKKKSYDKCYGFHFCPSIDWHGNIGSCLYMMNDDRFILKGQDYINVIPECQNCCKNHELNKLLYKVKNTEDVDFL